MAARGRTRAFGMCAGIATAGLLTLVPLAPASAQGIFETLFGGLFPHREAPASMPPPVNSYAPVAPAARDTDRISPMPSAERGPASAFCVRTCDGHYFPVRAHAGLSAADACRAFCPASSTRVYSGGGIDHAVASDGSRYADLPAAFLYRQRLVQGCTCNGRSAFGLAHVDVATDPTLKAGDVVATRKGLMAFTGKKDKVANFTPVESDTHLSKSERDRLAAVKIMPPTPGEAKATPLPLDRQARGDDTRHRAQLNR